MSRAVLRMLQTPVTQSQEPVSERERLDLSHVLGLYALALSVPLALFQPAILFDPLRRIVGSFGFHL
jgi:hypothetical protein